MAEKKQAEKTQARVRRLLLAVWGLAVLALALSFAARCTQTLAYNPVNGDFQSYNVFRRMLAGQTPYVDFANYVGMAPVVLNLPLLLLRGDFAASLFVTNATCCVLFCVAALAALWLITGHLPFSLLVSALLPKLASSGLLAAALGAGAGGYAQTLLARLYTPSNSMRMARLFWPFLLVLALLLLGALRQKRQGARDVLAQAPQKPLPCALWGGVCGLGVVWSNDFGLAAAFGGAVWLVLLLWRLHPGAAVFWRNLLLFSAALAAGAALAMTLVTGGRPLAYLRATLGVGQYQYFYFNGMGGRAALPYIFTNPRLLLCSAPYAAFLLVCLRRLHKGTLTDRLLLGGFLALAVLAGTLAYVVSGSGYNFTEALEGGLLLGAAGAAGRGVLWLVRRWRRQAALGLTAALCAAAVLFGALLARDAAAGRGSGDGAVYVQALGGWAPYPDALQTAAAFTAGGEVFSVYATGLEAVKGAFQPSGYDYIIHALGAPARRAYIDAFLRGEYPYVQTMDLELESWLCVANWDFYREVAARYQRALRTEYSWIWARAAAPLRREVSADVRLWQQDGVWHVEVTSDAGEDFVADVRVAYRTNFTGPLGAALSLGRSCVGLTVADPLAAGQSAGCWLPGQSDGWPIPVAVRAGRGEALLYPGDAACLTLSVREAVFVQALPDLTAPAGA